MANGHKYPRKGEFIHENLRRWKTPEGWLVHNSSVQIIQDSKLFMSESMTFVPDKDHLWELER